MTRAEAIQILKQARSPQGDIEADWIDRFVALGMLKLDEEPTPLTKEQAEDLTRRAT